MDDNFHNFLPRPWLGIFDPVRGRGGGEDVAGGCLCCEGMITGGARDQAGSSWGTNDRTYQA